MAYPVVNAPYGLQPIRRLDGLPYAGQTRSVPITSGYNTNIFYGDLVQIDSTGNLIKSAVTTDTTTNVVGVFVGVRYTNPGTKQPLDAQYYPANTVASDIVAKIIDDPFVVFKVAVANSAGVVTGAGRTAVASNATVIQGAGSVTTGNSGVYVLDTSVTGGGTTTATVLKVVDVVPETLTSGGLYPELQVIINNHQWKALAGV